MDFHWLNKSELKTDGNVISIYAPEASNSLCNAPFYYTDISK